MSQPIDIAHEIAKDENLVELESAPIISSDEGKSSVFDIFYQRSTYYWLGLFVNLSQIGFCTAGLALAIAHNDFTFKDENKGFSGNLFLATGVYSLMLLIFSVPTLYYHYKKGSDTGPKPYNAGKHYGLSVCAAMINFVTLYLIMSLGPIFKSKVEPCKDNVRPILYQLMIGFTVIGALLNITAARITSKAAKRARGSEMVPDPNHRVPAWTLATTEESQGLSGGRIRL